MLPDVPTQLRRFTHTVTIVMGALLVGNSIHVSFVTGQAEYLSQFVLAQLVGGVVLIAIGRSLYNPVSEAKKRYQQREAEASRDPDDEYDPEMSPIGGDSGDEKVE